MSARTGGRGTGLVLGVLASAQFLMTLDTSVMNVSIRQVAADVGTTVTGIQTAITLYTLVMASFMITGGKVGALLGRRRAFAIGLVVYASGSLTTALAPNLGVLLIGWSVLEGLGAALIMPAVVALVAGNFERSRRPAAYGMVAAAGAVAVAVGPLLGGAVTTFASWRWVFVGEVVICAVMLVGVRRISDADPGPRQAFDVVGMVLSVVGLSSVVYAVLRSGEWGWVRARPGGPSWFGISPVLWLLAGGGFVLFCFVLWEGRRVDRGQAPLLRPRMLANRQLVGGLTLFFSQFLVQAGVFFTIPLYLSVVLELSALQTGVRILPLSVALLVTAIGVPRVFPRVGPRLVVQLGLVAMAAGVLVLIGGIDPGAGADIVTVPMVLLGLGIGALASQLGAVTVSSVPDDQSAEVGGVQNTATNLGASMGTALVGAVLIASLTAGLSQGIQSDTSLPPDFKAAATVQLTSGVPFVSDTDLRAALAKASVPAGEADAVVAHNADARLAALRDALGVVALFSVGALFLTPLLPRRPVGRDPGEPDGDAPGDDEGDPESEAAVPAT